MRWKRAIVVGASSGIGRSIAERLAAEGVAVSLVARRSETLSEVCDSINARDGHTQAWSYPSDVRRTDDVPDLFQKIVTVMEGLDLIVYASGIQPVVGANEYPTDEDLDTVATNFSGAVAWLNEAAARFSRERTGTIIGISSIAGDRGRRGSPVYAATKAALTTYLEALHNRLAHQGVTVTTVKPGFVATPLLAQFPTPPFVPIAQPEAAAQQILDAAGAGRRVVYVPSWWRWVMFAIRSIPAPIFQRLNV
ncbi:MAG TPA: short-chain dehydrogenase [Chloroflexi bacterium]|jgi:short-subunit dehydrogenase|nr:short-chain dehydrogenase [Chloroflexota bacterium]